MLFCISISGAAAKGFSKSSIVILCGNIELRLVLSEVVGKVCWRLKGHDMNMCAIGN